VGPLAELRALCPHRPLAPYEARRVAELQANRLLRLHGIDSPPVPEQVVECLPRVEVVRRADAPVSGYVAWIGGSWLIAVNSREPFVRQRFTMAHELGHAVMAPLATTAFRPFRHLDARTQRERAANHFAGCLLMPKRWVLNAYFNQGVHDPVQLARRFQVSVPAMQVRLDALGIREARRTVPA
jgi:hypothetical protein